MKGLMCLLFLTALPISAPQPDYKPPPPPGSGYAGQGGQGAPLPGPPPGIFPLSGSGPPPGFGGPGGAKDAPSPYGGPKEAPPPYGGPASGQEGPFGGPYSGGEGPYGGERPYGGAGGAPYGGGGGAPYGGGQCDCLRWTNYISADTPGDTGDYETLGPPDDKGRPGTIHHVRPDVCTIPVRMECRTVYDKVAWYLPYEKITSPCNPLDRGFICENKKQKNGKCRDYEVRLLCFYADKADYSCPCLSWSQWYDNDDPNDNGDEELIGRKLPRYVCTNGFQPVDVQCATVSGLDVFHAGNNKVQCDLQGLSCYNEDQGRNCKCHDYKVRFLCPKFPATYPMATYGAYGKNATYGGDAAGGLGYNGGNDDGQRRGGGYDDGQRRGGGYDDGQRRGGGYDDGQRRGGGYDQGGSSGFDRGGDNGGGYDQGGGPDQGGGHRGSTPFGAYPGESEGFDGGPGGYDSGSRFGGGGPGDDKFGSQKFHGDYGTGSPYNGSRLNVTHLGGPGNKSEGYRGIPPLPFGIDERIKAGIASYRRGGGHHNESHGAYGGPGGPGGAPGEGPRKPDGNYNKRDEPDGTYTYAEKVVSTGLIIDSNHESLDRPGDAYEPGGEFPGPYPEEEHDN